MKLPTVMLARISLVFTSTLKYTPDLRSRVYNPRHLSSQLAQRASASAQTLGGKCGGIL